MLTLIFERSIMKKYSKIALSLVLGSAMLIPTPGKAGNPSRAGSAGGTQLLINPYARNSGQAGANSAGVRGLEAMFLNVAGTAFTRKTEVIFSQTSWLVGTGINISTFGLTQGVGETGTIGLGIMALNAGDIPVTTTEQPDGGLGTFKPFFLNIGLSYAKMFSDNIYGGLTVKILNEQISNVSARGVCLDAGIQYHTGKYDQIHFGIALKNVGPKMTYRGDGLSFDARILNGTQYNGTVAGYTATFQQRSAPFELPSLLNIGGAYDFLLGGKDSSAVKPHRVTVSANYTSNSFTYDQYLIGLEYGFKQYLMVRAGYAYEKGIFKESTRMTAFTGPTAGITLELPFGPEKKSSFGVDYSYRFTRPFNGVHSVGLRLNL